MNSFPQARGSQGAAPRPMKANPMSARYAPEGAAGHPPCVETPETRKHAKGAWPTGEGQQRAGCERRNRARRTADRRGKCCGLARLPALVRPGSDRDDPSRSRPNQARKPPWGAIQAVARAEGPPAR